MNRWIFAILGVLGLGATATTGACVFFLLRETPGLEGTLQVPPELTSGQTVDIVLTVTNPHDRAVTLDSVDIDEDLLKGFQVLNVVPAPKDTTRIPIFNQRSWTFGTTLAPKGQTEITFRVRCLEPGHYTGGVELCNANMDCTSVFGDLVVGSRPASSAS